MNEVASNTSTEKVSNMAKEIKPIDINAIVKKAREVYGKKEQGLARQISTGKSISRPTKESDFVVWNQGDHWKQLTHMLGIPYGRIIQIAGKPDSGKSTHAAVFMACAQKQGDVVILWDSERKFDATRFDSKMGGKSEDLLIVDTNNILNGAKAVAHLVNATKEVNPKAKILIVWDSVGASINSSEDQDDSEDFSRQPGISAKETSYAIRKFNKLANKYIDRDTGEETVGILVLNQTYSSIGMGAPTQIERGGTELTYLSSVILQLSRKKDLTRIKGGDKYKFGILSRCKVRKNHLFDSNECISELDIVVSADGIHLAKDLKTKEDITGWDEPEDGE